MRESNLQKAIVNLLGLLQNEKKLFFIRNNNFCGQITRRDGSRGYVKNNTFRGSADLIVFFRGGMVELWELKASAGKLSPDQKVFKEFVGRLGHDYRIIRSVDEAVDILKSFEIIIV